MRWSLSACAAAAAPVLAALSGLCGAAHANGMLVPLGYEPDQVANAQTIVEVAQAMHLDGDASVLGVTAALGESDLRDLDYGDNAINPNGTVADSVGLFQQQHWWGSYSQRIDPATAAAAFYRALETVPGWRGLAPTDAIHAVQGNADPNYYTPYVEPALELVQYLAQHVPKGTTLDSAASPQAATQSSSPAPAAAPGQTQSPPPTVDDDIDDSLLDQVGFPAVGSP